jgi:hypothetical protein
VAEPRPVSPSDFHIPRAIPAQEVSMRLSVPVTDAGSLIAVAAQGEDAGWFLIAIDSRLEELDRASFGSAKEIEAAARAHLRRNHPITPPRWS